MSFFRNHCTASAFMNLEIAERFKIGQQLAKFVVTDFDIIVMKKLQDR